VGCEYAGGGQLVSARIRRATRKTGPRSKNWQRLVGRGREGSCRCAAQYRAALASSYLAEVGLSCTIRGARGAAERASRRGEGSRAEAGSRIVSRPGDPIWQAITDIMSGLSYGPKAKEAINKAVEKAPNSSRCMSRGASANYYLPAQLGGGAAARFPIFKRRSSSIRKNAEAYLWLGISLRQAKQDAEARQAFTKSLR